MTDFIYSKEFEAICRYRLYDTQHATIHEWRNFVDYDLIGLYKDLKEAEKRYNGREVGEK